MEIIISALPMIFLYLTLTYFSLNSIWSFMIYCIFTFFYIHKTKHMYLLFKIAMISISILERMVTSDSDEKVKECLIDYYKFKDEYKNEIKFLLEVK